MEVVKQVNEGKELLRLGLEEQKKLKVKKLEECYPLINGDELLE